MGMCFSRVRTAPVKGYFLNNRVEESAHFVYSALIGSTLYYVDSVAPVVLFNPSSASVLGISGERTVDGELVPATCSRVDLSGGTNYARPQVPFDISVWGLTPPFRLIVQP